MPYSLSMRKKLFLVVGLVSLVAAIVWAISTFNDEPTKLYFDEPRGQASAGTKLGVSIGDPWRSADRALRDGFSPAYVLWQQGRYVSEGGTGVRLSRDPILTGDAEVSYRDGSWRNGVVTLILRDGRVTAIHWHYSGPLYIDL